jgi:RNA polymerase sigma factor (sigma-70 family)
VTPSWQCDEAVLARQRARILLVLLHELPEDDQLLLKLRYGFGLSQAAVGDVFSITQQAVRRREQMALMRARAVIERIGIRNLGDVM